MDPTSAFNAAANPASQHSATGGHAGSGDQQGQYEGQVQGGLNAGNVDPADPQAQSTPSEAQSGPPTPAPANYDILESRVADEQRTEDFLARRRLETTLNQEYGLDIARLNGELHQLQETLNNSSRFRLGWLKLTRQISKDPKRDVNLLQSTLEMYESKKAEARQALETTLKTRGQRNQPVAAASPKENFQDNSPEPQKRPAMSPEQAAARLQLLEDHRAEPVLEMHFRPGGKTEQYVHAQIAMDQEAEISALQAFLRTAPNEPEPAAAPEPSNDGPDEDPDDHLEPCL